MAGIILYLYFLFIGFLYADILFKEKDIYFRLWMGGIFGNVLLMAGIVPCAFICGFSVTAHVVLMVLSIVPYIIIRIRGNDKKIFSISAGGEEYMDKKIFFALILPITAVIWVLLTNHILAPFANGGYASGQSTYGDLQMHLSFITSIAEQKQFPPEYSLLAGERLNYPFFVDMLSSSLYLFGTSLRAAVLLPSYVITLLLVGGFYILAYSLTNKKSVAVLATVFFFFNGGLGFMYFLDGAKADKSVFTKIFTEYYKTPTNYNEKNIRWANTICDMIIPQRTTMAGWCMLMPALWLITDAIKTKKLARYIEIGILAGCMPMIHTHSFLALGIICAVLLLTHIGSEPTGEFIKKWAVFAGIVFVLAFPQLLLWTFAQTSGNSSFLNLHFNWVNKNDPYFWFYLKNWGIVAIFAVPAFLAAEKENKKLIGASLLIFVIAETILFQPNEYDNNKLFFVTYMILMIFVAEYLVMLYEKLSGVRGRSFMAVLVIILGTLSGVLTIGREYKSGAAYQTYSADDIAFADYVKKNTDANALFLTGTEHLNPVAVLAGRTIYVGSSLYVYFHGMGTEFTKRENEIKEAYSSYDSMTAFCEKHNVEYIFVGGYEKNDLKPDADMLSKLVKVYAKGNDTLYKLK